MFEAGLLAKGQDPSSESLAQYNNRLGDMFQWMQTRGLKLWLEYDVPITPVTGQNLYALGPTAAGGNVNMVRPVRCKEAYYTDQSQNRRPLISMGRSEWDTLSTVTTLGTITSWYGEKHQLTYNFYTWLTPDSTQTGTIHAILQQQMSQIVTLVDQVNLPIEWYLTTMWCLAAQICTRQPQKVIDRCEKMSAQFLEDLENWDVEDADTRFTPDTRTMNQGMVGRFNR
jgi:hypothetical protein